MIENELIKIRDAMPFIVGEISFSPDNSKEPPEWVKRNSQNNRLFHWTQKDFALSIAYSAEPKVKPAESDGVTLLLYGDIYNLPKSNESSAEILLQKYLSKGIDDFKELNGLFTILIINPKQEKITIYTDRLSSKKIFYYKQDHKVYFFSSLYRLPDIDFQIDPVSVFSYISNGFIFAGKTIFQGIEAFSKASIHTITREGINSKTYWHYDLSHQLKNPDVRELKEELKRLLIKSVQIRLDSSPYDNIFISLSGGNDSRAVMGILRFLGVDAQKVYGFTYNHGALTPNWDPYIAKLIAEKAGYRSIIAESFSGSALESIKYNALLGHGYAYFCDEVYAWVNNRSLLMEHPQNVIFVADMYHMPEPFIARSTEEAAFHAFFISSEKCHKNIINSLNKEIRKDITKNWRIEYNQIIDKIPKYQQFKDQVDFAYFDQRTTQTLMAWREFFQDPFAKVYNPFLDNEILDFFRVVPTKLRLNKVMYKETLREMMPELFEIPISQHNATFPDWRKALLADREKFEQILQNGSKLDAVADKKTLIGWLDDMENDKTNVFSYKLRDFISRAPSAVMRRITNPLGLAGYLPNIAMGKTSLWLDIIFRRFMTLRIFCELVNKY